MRGHFVIATKKDGRVRLYVNYRKLHQVINFNAYPVPRVEELLDQIGNAEFSTTLDLAKGYWQVLMSLEDKEKQHLSALRGYTNSQPCSLVREAHR